MSPGGSRLTPLASLGAQLVAVQETKLSCMQLETVRASLRRGGYSLHHGHPVPVHREGGHGDSGGVGVIASPGVAVSPLLPQGPAWRRLHAMTRLHGVQIPPRVRSSSRLESVLRLRSSQKGSDT